MTSCIILIIKIVTNQNVSVIIVQRRIRRDIQLKLVQRLKTQGAFWSYDANALSLLPAAVIIEECLRWGDVMELLVLFDLYPKDEILSVWQTKLIPDERMLAQNYYLARIYFGIEYPISYFEQYKKNSRYERLNKFTT